MLLRQCFAMCYDYKGGEDFMVTDRQYRELVEKFNELSARYTQMSKDIATIKMTLDIAKGRKREAPSQVRKDVTKYHFNGKQLNKRQLVLECIKQYISDSSITDAQTLLETFPDYIQGPLGVLRKAELAEKYSGAEARYFFKDNEVLHLDDGIYVVSKDWNIKNINRLLDIMETLGYNIKPMYRN